MMIKKTVFNISSLLQITGAFAILFFVTSFSGCKAGKDVSKPDKVVIPDAEAPSWVGNRPHDGSYYIGIGSCSKVSQPLDYQTIAKKNALNDLASEISVRVQGNTFLNTLEVNKNFSEEFISTINTTTDEKIENFEVAGIWENDKEFWTFYRLNKSEYQRQKMEKKNQILSSANDYFEKGKTAEEFTNIPAAFDLYMRGLFAMQPYWDEVNEYTSVNGKIYLDNEIFGSLQRICNGVMVTSNAQKIVLSADNRYNQDVSLFAEYEGKKVKGMTMTYRYSKLNYMKPKSGMTDEGGRLMANVSNVDLAEKLNILDVKLLLDPLIAEDLDKKIQRGLVSGMRPDARQIPIEIVTPSFYVKSEEKLFGRTGQTSLLGSSLNTELMKKGMRNSSSASETNFIVSIFSNTTEGGSSQGFVVAYLEMKVSVKNAVSGEILYEETLTGIKGLQLNLDAAGIDAYKKGKEKIENEIVNSILAAIM